MEAILKAYQKKLTNLTSTNKSLFVGKAAVGIDLDFLEFDFSNGQSVNELLELLLIKRRTITIATYLHSRDATNNQLSSRIKALYRRQTVLMEERGVKELYIGYPFVEGQFADGSPVRAPLLFFPVTLQLDNFTKWKLEPDTDNVPFFNPALLLAYSHYNQVLLEEEPFEAFFEQNIPDLLSFKNALYQFLKNSGITVYFNTDVYQQQLTPFKSLKRDEILNNSESGMLRLMPEALLGFFQQVGSLLYADYESILSNPALHAFETLFTPKVPSLPPGTAVKEEQLFTPFAIDAFQEKALRHVASGQSMVVQGPPGTGKSQLICNTIADCIAKNKRVLVVCQKRVALEVIQQRLREVGLHAFATVVHDYKHDRRPVFEALLSQIEQIEAYKQLHTSLDAIYLEREFLQASREIDRLSEQLEQLHQALFDPSIFEISAKELYLQSKQNTSIVPDLALFKAFSYSTLLQSSRRISSIEPYFKILCDNQVVANINPVSARWRASDVSEIRKIALEIPDAMRHLLDKVQYYWTQAFQPKQLDDSLVHQDALAQFSRWCSEPRAAGILQSTLAATNSEVWLQKQLKHVHKLATLCAQMAPEVLHVQPALWQQQILEVETALQHYGSWFVRVRFFYLKSEGISIRNALLQKQVPLQKASLLQHLESLKQSKRYSDLWIQIQKELQFTLEVSNPETSIQQLQNALEALQQWFQNPFIKSYLHLAQQLQLQTPTEAFKALSQSVSEYQTMRAWWLKYYTDDQIHLLKNDEVSKQTETFLGTNIDTIIGFYAGYNTLSESEKSLFALLATHYAEHVWHDAILHEAAAAWIALIEEKFPVLRLVSTPGIEQIERQLQQHIQRKLQLSGQIALLKAREATFKHLVTNRLQNVVSYRDLKHQITKKKRIWPLRKVLHTFFDEIAAIMPVWMASPETVSAIFSLDQSFDLVIFDEASQCFVEKGVPAMYRAKQLMVVGDDKQLQPNDLYRPRWDEQDDAPPEQEVDSVLQLADRYLSQTMLCEHYRSKHPDLIQFSNQAFYKNKLRLLPDAKAPEQPIVYAHVSGIWHQNSNEEEALKTLEYLQWFANHQSHVSVGVVTFNAVQQELIETRIDERIAAGTWKAPKELFVKNIENVQGDERDIIIFSTAYARDRQGNLHLQFGSLNQAGGENRLNVAITRARLKVIIVTSLLPDQLHVEAATNPGPKLFKAYLEYAYQIYHQRNVPTYTPSEQVHSTNQQLKQRLLNHHVSESGVSSFADIIQGTTAVFTDDERFYQAPSMKDWFGYVPITLSKKGWKIVRAYSRNYWLGKTFDGLAPNKM